MAGRRLSSVPGVFTLKTASHGALEVGLDFGPCCSSSVLPALSMPHLHSGFIPACFRGFDEGLVDRAEHGKDHTAPESVESPARGGLRAGFHYGCP